MTRMDFMSRKNKEKYKVMARRIVDIEGGESVIWPYEVIGETKAVSEKQAINNCRYKTFGNLSQYKPIETSGHYDVWIEFKAERCTS